MSKLLLDPNCLNRLLLTFPYLPNVAAENQKKLAGLLGRERSETRRVSRDACARPPEGKSPEGDPERRVGARSNPSGQPTAVEALKS